MRDSKVDFVTITKEQKVKEGDYYSHSQGKISKNEVAELNEKYESLDFVPLYQKEYGTPFASINSLVYPATGYQRYYKAYLTSGIVISEQRLDDFNMKLSFTVDSSIMKQVNQHPLTTQIVSWAILFMRTLAETT